MKNIKIKVGTMPVGIFDIRYKRKMPKIGDVIFIREYNRKWSHEWFSVRVWDYIREINVLFVEL